MEAFDHEDFNSSDLELPPPPPNPFAHTGSNAIQSMLDNAFSIRKSTKINAKTLTNHNGAPGTQRARSRWANMYNAFAQDVLKQKSRKAPTAEDIERFFDGIVTILRPLAHRQAVSFTYLTSGLLHLVNTFTFEYKDYRLDSQGRRRISSLFNKLLADKKLTKDPVREKQWLGCGVVHRLSLALIRDSLTHRTRSWDTTLYKALSLVLMAALSARGGDIARMGDYHNKGSICLCWKHVCVKVVRVDNQTAFAAEITLAFTKGNKDDPKKNKVVRIDSLVEPSWNVSCPVKLLLIVALRIGVTSETSIDDVIANAEKRVDKKIIWAYPEWPVQPRFKAWGSGVHEDQPASSIQFRANLIEAAGLAGIVDGVTTQDVRRGSARDVAYLPSLQYPSVDAAASSLGHTEASKKKGITQDYIGKPRNSNWGKVLDAYADAPMELFGVQFVNSSLKRKRNYTSQDLTALCKEYGLDPTLHASRQKASRASAASRRQQWATDQMTATETDATNQRTTIGTDASKVPFDYDAQTSTDPTFWDPSLWENALCEAEQAAVTRTRDVAPFVYDAQTSIDPALLELDNFIIADPQTSGVAIDDAIVDAYDPTYSMHDASTPPELLTEPLDFLRFFSRYNVLHIQEWDEAVHGVVSGSRDKPTQGKLSCYNAVHGCTYQTATATRLDTHFVACRSTSAEAHQALQAKIGARTRQHQCEKCPMAFYTAQTLKKHVVGVHDWTPIGCEELGCEEQLPFSTNKAYQKHRAQYHSNFIPTTCPIEPLTHTTMYITWDDLSRHLAVSHKMARGEMQQLKASLPMRSSWTPRACTFEGCTSAELRKTRRAMSTHFARAHKLKVAEASKYMKD
ncbi:hypothetical protein LTR16_002062 [Cryomyces antarcticus]|uniref:C2H2-type domain-containing protein n=1 Tax=Cryomyces antarcticus TaxID=329879 RepID=A0ABR0M0L5_9PEZI|nr:hypothetical protein LTR16_002062 [Cryomyces antarcticus]